MSRTNSNQQEAIYSCFVRAGTSVLALNSASNRLIAAGQQNFQLFSIESNDDIEEFKEIHDFRNAPRQSTLSRYAFQPKDATWNPNDENYFATANGTIGHLYIWDALKLVTVDQLNVHNNSIINRLQFHPQNANLLLTASKDGSAKLIDFRLNNPDRIVTTFRHSSKEAFRYVDFNLLNTNEFASVIHDQYSVPIWDIRQATQPGVSINTRDKVLCIAWNPQEHFWLATGGVGGHDRTIRVWDAKINDNSPEPLFTIYTFGQVAKVSWRPNYLYQIACYTRTTDPRIHVWDVRRAYLPQASFCHHRNDIEDFLWKPNSDNIISVGRDERLFNAHISSAIQSEHFASLFSLNSTPKGSVLVSMPNIQNEYVTSLCNEQNISKSSLSLQKLYSSEMMTTFLKWNKMIKGESILCNYSNSSIDDSIRLFHQFARRWTFGNGNKSLTNLANICDHNSSVAEDLNRLDLKATWQVIKMLYVDDSFLHSKQSKTVRSLTKTHPMNNAMISSYRRHNYQSGRRLKSIDKQHQDSKLNDVLPDGETFKSQDQIILTDSKLQMIDDTDTYIVQDGLADDIIFITPEDLINSGLTNDISYNTDIGVELRRNSLPITNTCDEAPTLFNRDGLSNNFIFHRKDSQCSNVFTIDYHDNEMENETSHQTSNVNMQKSNHSVLPGHDQQFFIIDERHCSNIQHSLLNFDEIIRQTLWHFVENNELQVAIHILLALYPQLHERKSTELLNGVHLQWLVIYIELLQKMRLFIKAKQVTKHCIENQGIPLSYNSTEFDGTLIFTFQAPAFKRLPPISSPTVPSINKNFSSTLKEFICSICRIPCRGLFSFCGICSHGGHIDHLQNWFKAHDECPYACGHRCKYLDNQTRRSYAV